MPANPVVHRISSEHAAAMTAAYRKTRTSEFPLCETFSREAVVRMLSNPQCVSMRIYYGLKMDGTVHAILVAADENGADILPLTLPGSGEEEGFILEDAQRCPGQYPPLSLLNG